MLLWTLRWFAAPRLIFTAHPVEASVFLRPSYDKDEDVGDFMLRSHASNKKKGVTKEWLGLKIG